MYKRTRRHHDKAENATAELELRKHSMISSIRMKKPCLQQNSFHQESSYVRFLSFCRLLPPRPPPLASQAHRWLLFTPVNYSMQCSTPTTFLMPDHI